MDQRKFPVRAGESVGGVYHDGSWSIPLGVWGRLMRDSARVLIKGFRNEDEGPAPKSRRICNARRSGLGGPMMSCCGHAVVRSAAGQNIAFRKKRSVSTTSPRLACASSWTCCENTEPL